MKVASIEVTLLDYMGSDLSVVNAARVSFEKEAEWEELEKPIRDGTFAHYQKLSSRDAKLIKYLADHEHTSPFNHAFLSFRVKAPIFVARQLVKHKFLPWNEVSRRYVDSEPEFFIPEVWRAKAENVKQGSSEEAVEHSDAHAYAVTDQTVFSLGVYRSLLEGGVCAEQARMVLPQNTMTEWIWSGSLGAFADMCRLRLDSHSQKETREVAKKVAESLEALFPVSFKALIKESNE